MSDIASALRASPGYYVRRRAWPRTWWIQEWEEHLWLYTADDRTAPWCPTPIDLLADDWEEAE